MIAGVREFFRTSAGKYAAIALVVVAVAICAWSIISNLGASDAAKLSNARVFLCVETNKPYDLELEAGMSVPAPSPYSGKATGYPAERCFWTADGKIKDDPTFVVLNEQLGKRGSTYCPDCGRLVVAYNPEPSERSTPPRKKDK